MIVADRLPLFLKKKKKFNGPRKKYKKTNIYLKNKRIEFLQEFFCVSDLQHPTVIA